MLAHGDVNRNAEIKRTWSGVNFANGVRLSPAQIALTAHVTGRWGKKGVKLDAEMGEFESSSEEESETEDWRAILGNLKQEKIQEKQMEEQTEQTRILKKQRENTEQTKILEEKKRRALLKEKGLGREHDPNERNLLSKESEEKLLEKGLHRLLWVREKIGDANLTTAKKNPEKQKSASLKVSSTSKRKSSTSSCSPCQKKAVV